MVKSAVLAWGSLVWDPRALQTTGKFTANGPLLPIEFCRVSDDGRLTLAIDEFLRRPLQDLFGAERPREPRCGEE